MINLNITELLPVIMPSIESRFSSAVAFAQQAHAGQVRKGSDAPYISHPLAVAALVIEFGGDEDQAIAALLHDVIEDCDPSYGYQIASRFGPRVFSIVCALTDGIHLANGKKPDWRQRKEAYIAGLENSSPDVHLVKACDAIHNATSTLMDVRRDGLAAFDKFRGGINGTIWYYREIAKAVEKTAAGPTLAGVINSLSMAILAAGATDNEGADCE